MRSRHWPQPHKFHFPITWEGEAPAEPQTKESVLLLAAQQELRPPGRNQITVDIDLNRFI